MEQQNFRVNYDKRVNRAFILLALAHIPIFLAVAWFFKTEFSIALFGPLLIALGPGLSYLIKPSSRLTSSLNGFAMMALSGVMIHLGKGMIEMHFHIFAFMAFLIFTGRLLPVLTALVTVAVHHIGFFFLLPASIFNYEASFGIVLLHAAFAIVTAIGCGIISLRFGAFIDVQETVSSNLSAIVGSHKTSSAELTSISNQITDSSTTQTSSIQESVSTLEEISRMVEMTNKSIQQTEQNSRESFETAEIGKRAVNSVTNSIQEISQMIQRMTKELNHNTDQIQEVNDLINGISEKTSIINDIVFQTKLLSFNASVEAARAGEHGKGFAIVAEEVGNLANLSGRASEEINTLIENSKQQVHKIVENTKSNIQTLTKQSEEVVSSGLNKAHDSISIIDTVVENIEKNNKLMGDISTSSNEQSLGVQEITEALRAIDRTNSDNIAMINQLKKLTSTMDHESIKLDEVFEEIHNKLENRKKNKIENTNNVIHIEEHQEAA